MLKMNIISKVIIDPISQEYLEELLREAITRQNPEVYVNSFAFTQRRSPACIEVTVDAQLGKPTSIEGEGGISNIVETVEEVQAEVPLEEVETAEVTSTESVEDAVIANSVDDIKPQSIADIFGG